MKGVQGAGGITGERLDAGLVVEIPTGGTVPDTEDPPEKR